MKKVFVICPVRNASREVKNALRRYVYALEGKGYIVHYPPWNTDQYDPVGNKICEQNFKAILEADEIHVWYDETSTGVHFDLGGAFMLIQILGYKKKVVFINKDPGKSFRNVVAFLEDETSKEVTS